MKHLPVILIAFSLLVALLVGCGGGHDARVTAELDRADSLLRTSDTAAHSAALRQMLALDTARALQSDEALRARHALLLVQARYKCYVTIPADSALIDSALRYYTDHHGSAADHERYTRSLIYKGAVAEELGHPQQAMQHYLEAESTADPNDHFNLGYTNLRMAVLLSSYYVSDGSDIEHYMKAYRQFVLSGERRYQGICLGNTGGILRITDNNVAKPFLKKGIAIMKEVGDSTYYYDFIEMLATSYIEDSCYDEAKKLIHRYLNSKQDFHKVDFFLTAASLYANQNNIDSSRYYLTLAHQFPFDGRDSIVELKIQSVNAGNEKNYRNKTSFQHSRDSIVRLINSNPDKRFLTNVEKNHATQSLDKTENIYHRAKTILFIILVVFIVFSMWITYYNYRPRKRLKRLLEHFKDEKVNEHHELLTRIEAYEEQVRCNYTRIEENEIRLKQFENLKATLNRHIAMMRKLVKLANSKSDKPDYINKKNIDRIVSGNIGNKEFWNEMEFYADETYHGFVTCMREHYSVLDEQEIRFLTLMCCGFTYGEIALIMGYSKDFISVKRSRIIKKMGISVPFDEFLTSYRV